eukprot:6614086-Lingulodinium_polyedra.AAC.1
MLVRAFAGPSGGGRTPPCTPALVRQLPPEAIEDLRRSFHSLEATLGIPAPELVVPQAVPTPPPRAESLNDDDPLLEVARPEADEAHLDGGDRGGGAFGLLPAETLVPHCPA